MNPGHMEGFDLLIIGCGNAAMTAALATPEGSRVALIEAAPPSAMGGNSRFTLAGFRFGCRSSEEARALLDDPSKEELELVDRYYYSQSDFCRDLILLSRGSADEALCRMLSSKSYETLLWMRRSLGVRWSTYISGIRPEPMWKAAPGNVYARGRGKGLVQQLLTKVAERQIHVFYEHQLTRLIRNSDGAIGGVVVEHAGDVYEVACRAVILACGGFEANRAWRSKYLGKTWEKMKVRGTAYNTGAGLSAALQAGAARAGQWDNGHAVPIAADAPDPGSLALGETTRRCLFQFGISVDSNGRRFMDEGANKKGFMYSATGVEVASREGAVAYQIFDSRLLTANFEKDFYLAGQFTVADSLDDLATQLNVPKAAFVEEVRQYNASITDDSRFDPSILDGCAAHGIAPARSNFAARIERPPYFGFVVTGGITFTYGGLKIDDQCRVLDAMCKPIPGLYAAGEAAGGFFAYTYPANSGLSRGAATGTTAASSAMNYLAVCNDSYTHHR